MAKGKLSEKLDIFNFSMLYSNFSLRIKINPIENILFSQIQKKIYKKYLTNIKLIYYFCRIIYRWIYFFQLFNQ